MDLRLLIPDTGDEITVRDVSKQGAMFVGKVHRLSCRGDLLALFHQLEVMANSNVIPEAERITLLIDSLGFVAQWPDRSDPVPVTRLQIMNGDDIAFEVPLKPQ